jgi:hypothetical protein
VDAADLGADWFSGWCTDPTIARHYDVGWAGLLHGCSLHICCPDAAPALPRRCPGAAQGCGAS